MQFRKFQGDINSLQKNESMPKVCKYKNGILKVEGRLNISNLEFNNKQQMILYNGRRIFFIMNLRPYCIIEIKILAVNTMNLAHKVVRNCVDCFRNNPISINQIIGNLPQKRITLDFLFANTAFDFCIPFEVKYKNQRKGAFHKILCSNNNLPSN